MDHVGSGDLSVVIINVGINILSLHQNLYFGDPPYSSSKTGAFNLTQYRFNFLSGKPSPLSVSVLWVAFSLMFLGNLIKIASPNAIHETQVFLLSEIRAKVLAEMEEKFIPSHYFLKIHSSINKNFELFKKFCFRYFLR